MHETTQLLTSKNAENLTLLYVFCGKINGVTQQAAAWSSAVPHRAPELQRGSKVSKRPADYQLINVSPAGRVWSGSQPQSASKSKTQLQEGGVMNAGQLGAEPSAGWREGMCVQFNQVWLHICRNTFRGCPSL